MRKDKILKVPVILPLVFGMLSFFTVLVACIYWRTPILWAARSILLQEYEEYCYEKKSSYDEIWIKGKSRGEIEEKYGAFEQFGSHKNGLYYGWPIFNKDGKRVPAPAYSECYYYIVLFDENGIAFDTDVRLLGMPGG